MGIYGGFNQWQQIDKYPVHFIQVVGDTRVISIMVSGIANINPVIGANMVGRKEGIEIVNAQNFILNAAFMDNSKEYQTRPVKAAKYKPGIESGFMIYFANKPCHGENAKLHEGMKFFDTEAEAWDYIRADNKQYAKENGELVEFEVEYDSPRAVLHRIETDPEKKIGFLNGFEGDYAFVSNETEQYDFFILSSDYGESEAWIIQEMDGGVRVWYNDLEDETFFGKESDIVFEKVGSDKYIKVAV